MEDKTPLLKRFDSFIFAKLDEFRKTPGHQKMLETYAGLDEEQQKFAKLGMLASVFLVPLFVVALVFY